MFSIITKSLKTGILTEANPFGSQASFGFPVIDFSRPYNISKSVPSSNLGKAFLPLEDAIFSARWPHSGVCNELS